MIQTYIEAFNSFINTASHGEPMVKGMLTMWSITVLGVVFRKLPEQLKTLIVGQLTTTVSITNEGNRYNRKNFQLLSTWFADVADIKLARSFMAHSTITGVKLSPGIGTNWFIFNKRLFKVIRHRLESSGSEKEKEEFIIIALSRNKAIVEELFSSFAYKEEISNDKFFKEWKPCTWSPSWQAYGKQSKLRAKNTVINNVVEEKIFGTIDDFLNKEEWYLERGLPWKKTLILYGEPGTGKTGIIRVIADRLDMDVHSFNLAMDAVQLKEAVGALPAKAIMVLEDFDIARVADKREDDSENKSKAVVTQNNCLYELLQTLDGLTSLNGTILILTTNHIDKIDSAVTRSGRIDGCIEVGKLVSEDIHRYIGIVYPNVDYDKDIEFKPIKGCDMADAYLKNRESVEGFIMTVLK